MGQPDVRSIAAFATVSLVWGLTWAAAKIGVGALPPLLLAGCRYVLAGGILALAVRGGASAFTGGRAARTVASSLLTIVGSYALIFWGMQHVPSGLAGLVNLALVPVILCGLAAATGEERLRRSHALALAIGSAGLVGLFWNRIADAPGASVEGLAAIVAGTACYCIGSVVARPLLTDLRPLALVTAQGLLGGVVLVALSLALERPSAATAAALLTPAGCGSLLFLAVPGTIVGYTLYLGLLRDWGSTRSGMYAFVSPIVAIAAGAWLFGEHVGRVEVGGGVALLAAAAIALSRRRGATATGGTPATAPADAA